MSHEKKKLLKDLQRRVFLRNTLGLSALSSFGFPISSAFSQVSNSNRKHLIIQLHGAPNRYGFDVFLNPRNQGDFKSNPSVSTQYVAETIEGQPGQFYTSTEYKTVKLFGMHVPTIWAEQVPKPGGGNRAMADLLSCMLQIRGVDIGNAAHPGAAALHFVPLGANISTPALATIGDKAPFTAIAANAQNYLFKSPEPKTPILLKSNQNYINELLAPFKKPADEDFHNLMENFKNELSELKQSSFDSLLNKSKNFEAPITSESLSNQLRSRSFPNLETKWDELVEKYSSLIQRVMDRAKPNSNDPIMGISDLPIGHPTERDRTYGVDDGKIIYNNDLRTLFNANNGKSPYFERLAEHFAFAEFVILENLTNSLTINPNSMKDASAVINGFGNPTTATRFTFDEHNTGCMPSLLVNTVYFLSFSACLLELITQLKNANMFEDTVIHTFSEFNRSPRLDGTGSDHGSKAGSVAFYSGRIKQPTVIGNVSIGTDTGRYGGTWGEAATNPVVGGKLNVVHLAASAAVMLGKESPYTAAIPLVREVGGEIVPIQGLELGRNI